MKLAVIMTTLFCVLQQINGDSNTEKNGDYPNNQNNYDTYASSFSYTSSPPLNTQQSTNTHQDRTQEDTQRQLSPDFSNYDTNSGSSKNDNQDSYSVRPKPVIKYSDEQLNLPNPYLVNSNIPKNGENTPCPSYYPCRTNTEVEENLNVQKHQPNIEFAPTLQAQIPTRYPEPNWSNQGFPQPNSVYNEPTANIHLSQSEYTKQQNSNEGKFSNSEITIVCYGLECSTQIKSPSNSEPISTKSDDINSQNLSHTSDMIKTFESQILKAIIDDLQYIRALTSRFSYDQQKPITVESQPKESIRISETFRTDSVYA